MDSVGIGALPDAGAYGDSNVNTLANIARSQGGLFLPTFEKLGLGCIEPIEGVKCIPTPKGSYGKMAEISKGKDTTTGHWELAGCPVFIPFPVYPQGFPPNVIEKFENLIGREVLGNKPASGTAIIEELGLEHMKTARPIVYTSGDSVFQIAAHEEIIPVQDLYEMCNIARTKVCIGKHAVGRVIARPFIGKPGAFIRTPNRHDFSVEPQGKTVLDFLKEAGFSVVGVGKIADIFAQRGITESYPTKSNDRGIEKIITLIESDSQNQLVMANLVDFDSVYGHRNDVPGYAKALEQLDGNIKTLLTKLNEDDLLILTADHGCDPTAPGTDHTREYVPLLVYGPRAAVDNLGIRTTFSDVAATIAENFALASLPYGHSFLKQLR
ncbi:Phosphopentomutase [bioreactor metagenome]|uniref:Phosphopentomutase n=1 Tax=bioreactor metagenome TaxID=1076179 RepID=A0A644T070_9ZZZZ